MSNFLFLLGREPELSLAELRSIFPDLQVLGQFAVITSDADTIKKYAESLGGTIKIAEVIAEDLDKSTLQTKACEEIKKSHIEGKKLRIAIDSFVPSLSSLVFKVKDALKSEGISIRVVQHDGARVKTATTIHEKLIAQGVELVVVATKTGLTLARTIWIQDIEAYTKRDMERERSMVVGMMPPKLAQIMVNLATGGDTNLQIWDPFCGLGTTLIEGLHMGYTSLIGSDLAEKMVETTKTNMAAYEKTHTFKANIFAHNAEKIDDKKLDKKTVIVTEGMLGKNFTSATLYGKLALEERETLTRLYRNFFSSASKNPQITTIVCCLPFWNVGRDIVFMPDIPTLAPEWLPDALCLRGKRYIQHMRPGQSVGREIIILRKKKSV